VIRCILCGAIVDNTVYFHCDDCRRKQKLKKTCTHAPKELEYRTTCKDCGVKLKAVRWESV
jgi:hypothetical protein